MGTKIFVNLPVKDLDRTIKFFTKLGYKFNAQFTNENATSLIISDDIYIMLLTEPFFKNFTKKSIVDATKSTEAIICLSAETREEVDSLVKKALDAGGTTPNTPQDHGWMYQHGYQDLDGHLWEIAYMDMSKMPQ